MREELSEPADSPRPESAHTAPGPVRGVQREHVVVRAIGAKEQLAAVLVERSHVRALAMQVDADRIHRWASFVPDFKARPMA
jgi:hypothetical protein